jgi:hypothetical protein
MYRMRKQIWLACVVCVLGVLPGLFVGAVAAIVYRFSAESLIGAEPDFYFLRTLVGFEAPGAIVKWIVFVAFPSVISGGVAGAEVAPVSWTPDLWSFRSPQWQESTRPMRRNSAGR